MCAASASVLHSMLEASAPSPRDRPSRLKGPNWKVDMWDTAPLILGILFLFSCVGISMDDKFLEERARVVRSIADKADPSTRKRLLDLAERYEDRLGRPARAM